MHVAWTAVFSIRISLLLLFLAPWPVRSEAFNVDFHSYIIII